MSIPSFSNAVLEQLCAVLADTSTGLTGSEIGRYLAQCSINDPHPSITKKHRLYQALSERQHNDQCANNILAFLKASYSPVLFASSPQHFETKRREINTVLAFVGLEFTESGEIHKAKTISSLSEASRRADRLQALLSERDVHCDVLAFCREELLVKNYFHAVLEASKSVADKIRSLTGLTSDGATLVNEAFTFKTRIPHLALSSLQTESEQGEQRGFANLLIGLFGTFRNPTAHAPRITWVIEQQDALDILSMISLAHRRLDNAVPAYRISKNMTTQT